MSFSLSLLGRTAVASVLAAGALAFAVNCDSTTTAVPIANSGGSSGSATGGMGGEPFQCLGDTPPAEAYDAMPGPVFSGSGGGGGMGGAGGGGMGGMAMGGMGGTGGSGGTLMPTEIGADAPVYQLRDYNPLSCGVDAVYGLDFFRGKVTVAALLAGW